MRLIAAVVVLAGSVGATPHPRVDAADAREGSRGTDSVRPAGSPKRAKVGSAWIGLASEYLDTYREYFVGSRGNSARDLERLGITRAKLQAAVPSADELYGALASSDERIAVAAVAAIAVSDASESRLLERILEQYPREPDPAVRQLVLNALSRAGSDWMRRHGDRVVVALATERHASLFVVAAIDVIPLLDREDLLRATSALVQNADASARTVLYSSVYLREGRSGLRALAQQLRQVGRRDLGAEAEAAEADRNRSKAR